MKTVFRYLFCLFFFSGVLSANAQKFWNRPTIDFGYIFEIGEIKKDSVSLTLIDQDADLDQVLFYMTGFITNKSNGFKLKYFGAEDKETLFEILDKGTELDHVLLDFNFDLIEYIKRPTSQKKIKISNSILFGFGNDLDFNTIDSDTIYQIQSLSLDNVFVDHLSLSNRKIKDFLFIGIAAKESIYNCKFENEVKNFLRYSRKQGTAVEITSSTFNSGLSFECGSASKVTFAANNVLKTFSIDSRNWLFQPKSIADSTKIDIRGSKLNSLQIVYSPSAYFDFNYVELRDTLTFISLFETNEGLVQLGNFNKIYFLPGSVIKSNLLFDHTKLNFNLENLARTKFEFLPAFEISHNQKSYSLAKEKYSKLVDYVNAYETSNSEIKAEVIAGLRFQEKEIEAKSYWLSESIIDKIRALCLRILKLFVNFGYHGESNFFSILIIVTLIWSFIYFFLFKGEIHDYINLENKNSTSLKNNSSSFIDLFVTYFKCLWFSFIILISPKFPASFFSFSAKMIVWVIIEWLFGLFLTILFIVYIASQYPFIKMLFGL